MREWLKHLLLGHIVDLEVNVWVSTGSSRKARAGRGRAHLVLLGSEQSLPPGRPLAALGAGRAAPEAGRAAQQAAGIVPRALGFGRAPPLGWVSSGFWDPALPTDT